MAPERSRAGAGGAAHARLGRGDGDGQPHAGQHGQIGQIIADVRHLMIVQLVLGQNPFIDRQLVVDALMDDRHVQFLRPPLDRRRGPSAQKADQTARRPQPVDPVAVLNMK